MSVILIWGEQFTRIGPLVGKFAMYILTNDRRHLDGPRPGRMPTNLPDI